MSISLSHPHDLVPAQRIPFDVLRGRVQGVLAEPGDEAYDALVSPWNLAIPVRPAAVVAARSADDVVEAVRFAGRHGLTVTPQATGHGPIQSLVGEILVSTAGLDECVVYPEGWARVGAGVKWGRVIEAAAPHGLAPLSGSTGDVGVVGYTTGGGIGPMARTYGLAIDRVRAFEVVTGDGVLRRVTANQHPELFFGLRGGKGALGIVTAVEFDLVEQPTFYGGSVWFDGADAAAVVERWRTWSAGLPEQGTTSLALMQLPPMPGVPPQLAGRLTVSVRYVWTGTVEDGACWFAKFADVAPILLGGVDVMPYAAIDAVHMDPVDPMPSLENAVVLRELPAAAAAALVRAAGPGSGSAQVIVELRQMGGAMTRPGAHDSAYCLRDAAYSLLTIGVPAPGVVENARAITGALAPWAMKATLPNFTFRAEQLPASYDERTLRRLRAAIQTYDPHGVIAIGRAFTA